MTRELIQARRLPMKLTGAEHAHCEVAKAVRRGDLLPANTQICCDCSAPASAYDHRDYARPLDVDAVCDSCNARRGKAIPCTNAAEQCRDAAIESEAEWRHAASEPQLVPFEIVEACDSFHAAVRAAWDLRTNQKMTRASLAERVGIHAPHITDVLSGGDRKGKRTLHPDQIADFELAVGNRVVTQFLLLQVGFTLIDNTKEGGSC
ncbi:helix-turn-helix transcriptional regulator [Burkholderia sp. Ac-20344]|uniref:helix-turn-helix domain-containing protein n=1 Tax=Burkholderia sp. Ac-20344 TaxID=2703890 RepID=UPI00197BABDB|nr:helix-turn-helix transcriptional regulator [Burkholderia sp. Ac-20344]MBN3832933.1 helix-turn-helix transcriptional regulator [Burkholderia sp. Ac-20344]